MKLRIDQLAIWGCDWVEFDNMDWAFDDNTRKNYNFQVTNEEAITYYNELCDYVHSKGMKCIILFINSSIFLYMFENDKSLTNFPFGLPI